MMECRNLSVGYDGKSVADNISFTLEKGSYLCIVGENGAGKSTLMKTLLGLLKPLGGIIETSQELSLSNIGYLPQQTDVQKDFPASVKEIVLSGCQSRCGNRPFYNSAEKELANENMNLMGISDLSKRCYRELSGGQQQRVLLARALCATRECLLLDEPVAGLDPKVTSSMYELIKKLNDDGIAIIMVTHDMDAAIRYASHILHVGASPFFGTKEEYMACIHGRSFLLMKEGEE